MTHRKADVVREVASISSKCGQKTQNFTDIFNGCSLSNFLRSNLRSREYSMAGTPNVPRDRSGLGSVAEYNTTLGVSTEGVRLGDYASAQPFPGNARPAPRGTSYATCAIHKPIRHSINVEIWKSEYDQILSFEIG